MTSYALIPAGPIVDHTWRLNYWRRRVLCASDLNLIEAHAEQLATYWGDDDDNNDDDGFLTWDDAYDLLCRTANLFPHPHDGPIRDAGRRVLEDLFGERDTVSAVAGVECLRTLAMGERECA